MVFRRCTSKSYFLKKGRFLSPFRSRDGVHHALGLVDLDLGLLHALTKSLAGGGHLTGGQTSSFRDGITGEHALVGLQEAEDSAAAVGSFLLLLAVGALALLVAGIKASNQLGGGGVHLIGQVGVKNGLEVLASGHGFSFLRFMRSAVGRYPIFILLRVSFPLASII